MPRPADPDVSERIIQSAMQLFMHYGYRKTTMDDIAREACVAKGSLYLHFSNKAAVLTEVIRIHAQKNLDNLKQQVCKQNNPELGLKTFIVGKALGAYDLLERSHHAEDLLMPGLTQEDLPRPPLEVARQFLLCLQEQIEMGVKRNIFKCANPQKIVENIQLTTHGLLLLILHHNKNMMIIENVTMDRSYLEEQMNIYVDMVIASLKIKTGVNV
jgi:AcrR family transcriptional regulator